MTKLAKKGTKQKKRTYHWILHIGNSIGTKFSINMTVLNFWTKLKQKWFFRYLKKKKEKRKKKENRYPILHIWIILISLCFNLLSFSFNKKFSAFWNKFPLTPNEITSGRKQKKMNVITEFLIFQSY